MSTPIRIYLDLCCLKRPFDLQDQPLVRIQTEAVLSLLDLPSETVHFVRSQAHQVENSFNTNAARREAVDSWILGGELGSTDETAIFRRVEELVTRGFGAFDSLHLAYAERADATVFLTVDRKLQRLADRFSKELRLQVSDPVHFFEEFLPWRH